MDKIDPPLGYRLLEEGETIPAERMIWIGGVGPWARDVDIPGGLPWTGKTWRSAHWTLVAVPTVAPAPGSPEDLASLAELDALIPPVPVFKGASDPQETLAPGASLIGVRDPDDRLPTYNNAMTHCTIPATHEWAPKPFTPNKYTRELLTLDGRRVPVDVYSVLAAFPVGNAAVDHALKKLLAPGQRGQKDRLQDLKEARASLDRAIQMEGG